MKRELLGARHLVALVVASLILWLFRESSDSIAQRLQSATVLPRGFPFVGHNPAADFALAMVMAVCISAAQELRSPGSWKRALGIGILIGLFGLASPSTREASELRAVIMMAGYIIASLILFAFKHGGRRDSIRGTLGEIAGHP